MAGADGLQPEPEQGKDGAPTPRRLTMMAMPGEIGIAGADGVARPRPSLEPGYDRAREAIADRLEKLEARSEGPSESEYVDRQWENVDIALHCANAIDSADVRDALLDGIAAALSLGFLHRGGRKLAREGVAKAIEASTTPAEVTGIIEERSTVLRRKLRYRLAGATTVAGQIWSDVGRDLDKTTRSKDDLKSKFRRWAPYYRLHPPIASRKPTDEVVKAFKEALRKVIERADKRRSSG